MIVYLLEAMATTFLSSMIYREVIDREDLASAPSLVSLESTFHISSMVLHFLLKAITKKCIKWWRSSPYNMPYTPFSICDPILLDPKCLLFIVYIPALSMPIIFLMAPSGIQSSSQ
jgi:hypothetical protein